MLVAIIWIFGYSVNWMYTGFGIILCAAVMLPKFSAAKILPNPKLKNKRKIFIQGRSKQYGFASQEFLVVRGNGWGFLWSGRHTRRWKEVGVCQFQFPSLIPFISSRHLLPPTISEGFFFRFKFL